MAFQEQVEEYAKTFKELIQLGSNLGGTLKVSQSDTAAFSISEHRKETTTFEQAYRGLKDTPGFKSSLVSSPGKSSGSSADPTSRRPKRMNPARVHREEFMEMREAGEKRLIDTLRSRRRDRLECCREVIQAPEPTVNATSDDADAEKTAPPPTLHLPSVLALLDEDIRGGFAPLALQDQDSWMRVLPYLWCKGSRESISRRRSGGPGSNGGPRTTTSNNVVAPAGTSSVGAATATAPPPMNATARRNAAQATLVTASKERTAIANLLSQHGKSAQLAGHSRQDSIVFGTRRLEDWARMVEGRDILADRAMYEAETAALGARAANERWLFGQTGGVGGGEMGFEPDVEVAGRLQHAQQLMARFLRDENDGSYGKRIAVGNQLTAYLLNAPAGSELTEPHAAEAMLRGSGNFDVALEDVRAPAAYKQAVVKVLSIVGRMFRLDAGSFFHYLFERLNNPEVIDPSPRTAYNYEHLMPKILLDLQHFLDHIDGPDYLPKLLDVFHAIAEKYPNSTMDQLIAWHINASVPKSIHGLLSDSLKKFWEFWRENLPFGNQILKHLLDDMEKLAGVNANQPAERSKKATRVAPPVFSCLRCCQSVIKALRFASFSSVNPEAGEVLEANPNFLREFLAAIQRLLVFMLEVGELHQDRAWINQAVDIVKSLSKSMRGSFSSMQHNAVQIYFLELVWLLDETVEDPSMDFADIERWLVSFEDLLQAWLPNLDLRVVEAFLRPESSPLGNLRTRCYTDPAVVASYIRISIVVFSAHGSDDSLGSPYLLLEAMNVLQEIRRRHVAESEEALLTARQASIRSAIEEGIPGEVAQEYEKDWQKALSGSMPLLEGIANMDVVLVSKGAQSGTFSASVVFNVFMSYLLPEGVGLGETVRIE
ncbi:hypothetical protein HK101_009368 [Irineochytrium annulatum]|nr:hypothetical protein HK101_009368 [Irineochytrium annulatum]